MSAREEVLRRVRAALGPQRRPDIEVDRGYRTTDPSAPEGERLLDLFVERVVDYRAQVHRASPADLAATVAQVLGDATRVAVPPGLDLDVSGAVPDDGLTAADLESVDAVVTRSAVAIAETGTVILDHGPGQGRRVLTLLPDVHVCIVDAAQVVPGVVEAVDRLDPTRPQTWVSGPSATSDIELSRVEGVHGPRTLHVVLVSA